MRALSVIGLVAVLGLVSCSAGEPKGERDEEAFFAALESEGLKMLDAEEADGWLAMGDKLCASAEEHGMSVPSWADEVAANVTDLDALENLATVSAAADLFLCP